MEIKILTPEKLLFEGEIKSVKLQGLNGKFEILNNHAPIVSVLVKSDVVIKDMEDNEHTFSIKGGMLEMSDNKISILVH